MVVRKTLEDSNLGKEGPPLPQFQSTVKSAMARKFWWQELWGGGHIPRIIVVVEAWFGQICQDISLSYENTNWIIYSCLFQFLTIESFTGHCAHFIFNEELLTVLLVSSYIDIVIQGAGKPQTGLFPGQKEKCAGDQTAKAISGAREGAEREEQNGGKESIFYVTVNRVGTLFGLTRNQMPLLKMSDLWGRLKEVPGDLREVPSKKDTQS